MHSLFIEGSSGEFSSLSIEERKRVYELSIDEANGKVPVIAGVSHSSTRVAVELAKYAVDAGADAVQAVPPYYFQLGASSLFEHYKTIAEAVDVPVGVYDNPGATHQTISVNLMARLCREIGVCLIKICPYPHLTPLAKSMILRKSIGNDINIIVATAQYAYFAFSMGVADGVTSAVLNVFPRDFVKMYDCVQSGDYATARRIQYERILPLCFFHFDLVKEETVYPQVGKLILKWRGVIPHETVRKPLSPLKDWQIKHLRAMLEETEMIS